MLHSTFIKVLTVTVALTVSVTAAYAQNDMAKRWMDAGSQAMNNGDDRAAAAAFTRAVFADPSDMVARRNLARAELAGGRAQHALEIMRQVLQYDRSLDSWVCLGDAHFGLAQLDQAQASYEQAIRLAPLSPAGNAGLVNVLVARHQYSAAQQLCRRLIAATPDKKMAADLSNKLTELEQYGKEVAAGQS